MLNIEHLIECFQMKCLYYYFKTCDIRPRKKAVRQCALAVAQYGNVLAQVRSSNNAALRNCKTLTNCNILS